MGSLFQRARLTGCPAASGACYPGSRGGLVGLGSWDLLIPGEGAIPEELLCLSKFAAAGSAGVVWGNGNSTILW